MNLKKYSWLAILPMVFTACQDDMLVETSSRGITTLTASMGDKATGSRAQIVLNGSNKTKEIFHWNEGDAFTVFQLMTEDGTGLSSHRFSIADTYSDDEPTASADFSTLDEGLSTGRNFVAFYPTPVMDENSTQDFHLTLDGSLPDNSNESWVEYFKNNMFMTTTGSVSETTGVTGLTFKHLCGIIRISYFNDSPAERTISRIGVDGSFGNSYGYQLGGDCSIWESMGTTDLGISFKNGATVAAGETANFYILFMDSREPEEDKLPLSVVRVDFEDGTATGTPVYSKTLPLFQVGKSYWLNVTDNGERLLWSKDIVEDDGGDTNPNEAFVADFDDLQTALGNGVENIFFEEDIALEAPLSIQNSTNFVMEGHTLSLSDTYDANGESAVFNLEANLTISNGTVNGKEGSKLHDYYFALNGEYLRIRLNGVALNTGTAVENAIFMDDDYMRMYPMHIEGEEMSSSIVTQGNAIHFVGVPLSRLYTSNINGTISGNIRVESEYDRLNANLVFESGSIDGNLDVNFTGGARAADCILLADKFVVGSGYTGWEAAGRYVPDQNYTIFELKDLKTAFETPQVEDEMTFIFFENDLVLTEPLTVEKPVQMNMHGRTISISDSFNWGTAEAAITVTNGSFNIDEGTIQGSSTVADGKYLIKYSGDDFGIHQGVTLDARGVENALLIENSRAHIDNATIHVSEGGFAVNALAESNFVQLIFEQGASVTGNVGFTANYPAVEPEPNVVAVAMNSTVNGDLIVSGTYKDDLIVDIYESTVDGAGWNDAAIALMQKEFSEHGGYGIKQLTLSNDQEIVLTVGTTSEGNVHFDTQTLDGSGSIKFVNDGTDEVTINMNIENLGDDVDVKFEGNFRKQMVIGTTRVKEFFEMASGADQIEVFLSDDVTLTEQIVIDSSMQWTDGSESSGPQGHLSLLLGGHTITSNMDVPAIVVQGGFFTLSGRGMGESVEGFVKSKTEFIQIGAGADASNNQICLMMRDDVTFNIESATWVYANALDANLTSHKNLEIYINSMVLTDDEKEAKVRKDESYNASVFVGG